MRPHAGLLRLRRREMCFSPADAVRATKRGRDFVASGLGMFSVELVRNSTKLASHCGAYPQRSLTAPVGKNGMPFRNGESEPARGLRWHLVNSEG